MRVHCFLAGNTKSKIYMALASKFRGVDTYAALEELAAQAVCARTSRLPE